MENQGLFRPKKSWFFALAGVVALIALEKYIFDAPFWFLILTIALLVLAGLIWDWIKAQNRRLIFFNAFSILYILFSIFVVTKLGDDGLPTRQVIGEWGVENRRIYVVVLTEFLGDFRGETKIALVCRAYDALIDFQDDSSKHFSNWRRIGMGSQRLELPLNDQFLEELTSSQEYQCGIALSANDAIEAGDDVTLLRDRVRQPLGVKRTD